MIGILLLSHGEMAKGMAKSCTLFFGDDIEKLEAIGLESQDAPESLDEKINGAIKKLDDGSGVLIMCDLIGGTPFNRCMLNISNYDNVELIAGMNFTMLLEFLGQRLSLKSIHDLDINQLMNTGREGIKSAREIIQPSKSRRNRRERREK